MAKLFGPAVVRALLDNAESRLRLQTTIRLRWFAVLGQAVAIAFVYYAMGFPLPIGYCLLLISISAWLNIYLKAAFPVGQRLGAGSATLLLAYDILQLAGLLYLTGGIDNPFLFLIIAPVTVSAATLPTLSTVLLGLLAGILSVLLIDNHLPLPWHAATDIGLPQTYKLGILASVYASMVFLALYAWRLSREARQMSAALAATEIVLGREQRLQALDGLAAAAAHELGTPLSTIAVVAKELERAATAKGASFDPAFVEDVRLLRAQAMRCREILQKLSREPSERDPMHGTLPVTQLIDEAARPYLALERKIKVDAAPAPGTPAAALPEPVGERRPGVIYGLGNIIENAQDFANTSVEITARWSQSDVSIVVRDDGPGFPVEVIDLLGEPYVTTRGAGANDKPRRDDDRAGLGLGFFIAKTLLERSGAEVTFANRLSEGSGAMVRIQWPRSQFEAVSAELQTWPSKPPRATAS